ncbi:hypothetical protein bcere0028_28820 [Bacillus cereus AH1271]|nr:hypothetical protein bcere0028_28820 [Bacillus cereus AH1271]
MKEGYNLYLKTISYTWADSPSEIFLEYDKRELALENKLSLKEIT